MKVKKSRKNPHQIIADRDVLSALSIGFIRCFYEHPANPRLVGLLHRLNSVMFLCFKDVIK